MTNTSILRPNTRTTRRDATAHLFEVGEAVRLRGGFGRPTLPADIYHITGTLPPRGGSPQYRIRSDDERHERVTTQDSLEPVSKPLSGSSATLMERTFSNGQRTATQQSREKKTEAEQGSTKGG